MSSDELEPCPFCGSEADYEFSYSGYSHKNYAGVRCKKCWAKGPKFSCEFSELDWQVGGRPWSAKCLPELSEAAQAAFAQARDAWNFRPLKTKNQDTSQAARPPKSKAKLSANEP